MINQPSSKYSRKFSIIFAVLILLIGVAVGGYLVLKSGRGSASQLADILSSASKPITGCQPDASDSNKDSDNDGLKDWQELQIYKTDACKQDSDGDGYLDSEEIASGYDPTKKAPGDELPGTKHTTPRPLPQNLTEALRQSLKNKITQGEIPQLDLNGKLLTASSTDFSNFPAVQSAILEVSQNYANFFSSAEADSNNTKTNNDNSAHSIKQYFFAVSVAIQPQAGIRELDSQIFSEAIESNDYSKLESVLQNYQGDYARLKELTVPSELTELHKKLLNIFSGIIKIYSAVKDFNSDPLKAYLALQSYPTIRRQQIDRIIELNDFLYNRQ